MKIISVQPINLRIPFSDGSLGKGIMPVTWNELDICLTRIETDNGLVGWGEGFGYFCNEAVAAIIERSIAPIIVGKDFTTPELFSEEIQRKMVLQGRYGISTFALSGVDLALWDLAAKIEQVSVAELMGGKIRDKIPAYASLVRYGDTESLSIYIEKAIRNSFSTIKLHEITMEEIRACRRIIGDNIDMIVDVNCNWTEHFTYKVIPELISLKTLWLEEPIFPPENFRLLSEFREKGISIAAGENACTAMQFSEIINFQAVDFLQPSITKVGGLSEYNKISLLNRVEGIPIMAHSPYFGPGYLATLQIAAVEKNFGLFEFLYVEPEAWLYKKMPLPQSGEISIPEGYGFGLEPDMDVVEKYKIK
jgi:L-alanine-DL-glutamate epimerase-like enolase superfamily enzyme